MNADETRINNNNLHNRGFGGRPILKAPDRITFDPQVMGGKPCIRGMRVTVGTVIGLLASGHSRENILELYPYLEPEDIDAALQYAAWRVQEVEFTPPESET